VRTRRGKKREGQSEGQERGETGRGKDNREAFDEIINVII
jgi:hypothetical protein